MLIRALAVFDGDQWDAPSSFVRPRNAVDVLVFDTRPAVGELAIGFQIGPEIDSYDARRWAAEDSFGGEVWLVVGVDPELSRAAQRRKRQSQG